MKTIARLVDRFPRSIIAVTVVVTVFFAWQIATKFEYKKDLFTGELPYQEGIEKIKAEYGNTDALIFSLENLHGIGTVRTLRKIVALSDALEEIPDVRRGEVWSLATVKIVVQTEDGDWIERTLLDVIPETEDALAELMARVMSNPIVRAFLIVSDDGTTTTLSAPLEDGYDQVVVAEEANRLVAEYTGDGDVVRVLGEPIPNEAIRIGVNNDTRLMPLAFLVMILIAGLCMGSWKKGLVLVGGATVLTVLWTVGLSVVLGFPQSIVMSCVPVVMLVLAGDPAVQLELRRIEEMLRGHPQALTVALCTTGGTIVVTIATTAFGFGSLVNFGVASIENFGVTIACGAVFSFWMAFFWNGALQKLFPRFWESARVRTSAIGRLTAKAERGVDLLLEGIIALVTKRAVAILWVSGLLFIAALAVLPLLRVGSNPMELFPKAHPVRLAEPTFKKNGGFKRLKFVLKVGNVFDPAVLRLVQELQGRFEDVTGSPTVSLVDPLKYYRFLHNEMRKGTDILPETEREAVNLQRAYGSPRDQREWYRKRREESSLRIDVRVNELDQGRQIVLQERLVAVANETIARAFLHATPEEREALGSLKSWWGGNEVAFWTALTRYIFVGKVWNIIVSPLGIFVILWVVFRRWALSAIAIVPLILATTMTFGVMAILGIHLDIATSVVSGIAAGIGADFAVHLIERLREEARKLGSVTQALTATIRGTGKAIVTDAVSMSLGFLVLQGSDFTPLQHMSMLVAINMTGCAAATLLTLPAIVVWKGEKLLPLLIGKRP